MANDDSSTKNNTSGSANNRPGSNAGKSSRDKQKNNRKNIPTMMKAVTEPPPDIDLDLLDIPILTDKVEADSDIPDSDIPGSEQELDSDLEQEHQTSHQLANPKKDS